MTSSGQRLRVKGQGVKAKDGTGDLFVEIHIKLPPKVDDSLQEKIQQLDGTYPRPVRADLAW